MALNYDQQTLEDNLMVLSNVNELASAVVQKISGNDVANTLDKEALTPIQLRQAVAARMKSSLIPFMKG
ncbi:MAG TPA: hypothetical protein VN081_06580 [Dongiaceae bacterium]|nr:hypothetical protein [Dongiaceae bacterium]